MDASEIQRTVLNCLRAVGVTVLRSTLYSLSSEPEEEDIKPVVNQNEFLVTAVMTRSEFIRLVECCNEGGVWVNYTWEPYGRSIDMFLYQIVAVEMRP